MFNNPINSRKNSLGVGKRYVFFSSLNNDDFDLGSYGTKKASTEYERQQIFRYAPNPEIAKAAEDLFSNINRAFSPSDLIHQQTEGEFYSLIREYIKQMEMLAEVAQKNELEWLKKHRKILEEQLQKAKTKKEKKEIQDLLNSFPKGDDKDWDYSNIITLFNKLRKDNKIYQQNFQNIYEQLKEQTKKLKDIDLDKDMPIPSTAVKVKDDGIKRNLKKWYLERYEDYKLIITAKLKDGGFDIKPIKDSLSEQLANKATSILRSMTKDPVFIGQLEQFYMGQMSKDRLKSVILDSIVAIMMEDLKRSSSEVYKEFKQSYKKYINLNLPPVSQVFESKGAHDVSLERLALEQGEELANYFIDVYIHQPTSEQKMKLLNDFGINQDSNALKAINKIINKNSRGYKSLLTKILKEHIIAKLSEQTGISTKKLNDIAKNIAGLSKEERKQQMDALFENIQDQNLTYLPDMLNKSLQLTRVRSSSMAEIQSTLEYTLFPIIQRGIQGHGIVHGNQVNKKADASWTVHFTPFDISHFDTPDPAQQLMNAVDSFKDRFMEQYKASSDSTSVDIPYKIIEKQIDELAQLYTNAELAYGKDSKEMQELNQILNDTFFSDVSVKEYTVYNNGLGFKGGSLGGDYGAIEAIDTIDRMYSKIGGFSKIDKEILISAVLNCSSEADTILMEQFPNVIENVKNYLLGGAVLSIFDEGFINTKKILNKFSSAFNQQASLKTTHLYMFDTFYVPESYVLFNVCENLQTIYNNLQLETRRTLASNRSSIEIINRISNEDIPDKGLQSVRWDTVATTAASQTKIYVLLLAGLLDLFEDLPELITKIK